MGTNDSRAKFEAWFTEEQRRSRERKPGHSKRQFTLLPDVHDALGRRLLREGLSIVGVSEFEIDAVMTALENLAFDFGRVIADGEAWRATAEDDGRLHEFLASYRGEFRVELFERILMRPTEALAVLGSESAHMGRLLSGLQAFDRRATKLPYSDSIRRAISDETTQRLADLEMIRNVVKRFDLQRLRNKKRSPLHTGRIIAVAELFLDEVREAEKEYEKDSPLSKLRAYRETARVLRLFDAKRYGDITDDVVRRAVERSRRPTLLLAPAPKDLSLNRRNSS